MNLLEGSRICAVIAEPAAVSAAKHIRAATKRTRLVELRLDYFPSMREALRLLKWLRKETRRGHRWISIATCRRREAGGLFAGSIADQLSLLRVAVDCGCQWADVEIQTARQLRPGTLKQWLAPAKVMVSDHQFGGKRQNLQTIHRVLKQQKADAEKIAARTNSLREGTALLALARGNHRTITVPMGAMAAPLRVLALPAGSPLGYAATRKTTAPGQLSLEEMAALYRADRLTRRTQVYGVIGNPVSQSLSPQLHNAGFRARHVDAVFLPFLVDELTDFVSCIQPLGIRGFAVTLPHKEAILRHLDDCDPLAEAIGAVNTVVVRGGKLIGFNTDYVGVLRALERRMPLAASRVLVLGAGGTARAVSFALARAGATVAICSRRAQQSKALANAMGGAAMPRRALRQEWFDAIVNTTPVGMSPKESKSPLHADELRCRLVFDAVYRPARTRLLQLAAGRGIECVSGVEMFLAQGMAQWEIWMGQRAPETAMRKAVNDAVRR
jgi:3-dehydroquinate dehydratase / shikimate dehydrogenase